MDADLQHPSSLIPEMVDLWRQGAEIVYTIKKNANLSIMKHITTRTFYWFISKISGLRLNFGQSDFRLIDRKVLEAIIRIPEYHKFLRGQVEWLGFKQQALAYNVEKRHSGESKFSSKHRFSFALDGIFAFSRRPLRIIMRLGILLSTVSFFYITFVVVVTIMKNSGVQLNIPLPSGWATLIVAVLFMASIQLISLGILGEYVGRIFDQVKGRPVFIVREAGGVET
jgi:hypothetical protein